ncbi:MAG: TrkH family potassium uptake protein [Candidatus Eisenbacteria bacterium]|nr:TrkH family potassium uptake protein [Candidatus Eisenbacteria bacterium]
MRHTAKLVASYRAMGRVYGSLLMLLGAVHLAPLPLLIAYPDELPLLRAFLAPGLGAAAVGLVLRLAFRRARPAVLTLQDGVLVTFLAWSTACLLSSLPLFLSGYSGREALFESVSGWSTTGLTLLDATEASPLILFWRAFLQLLGGAGLVLVISSALAGPWATGLYQAEGHGEPLLPHLGRTARMILGIYLGYTVLGMGAFLVAGMGFFDAVLHAMTALSTGGFSTRNGSLGEFDSRAVEGVALVLMFLGNLNFVVHFLILRGKWRQVLRHGELHVFAAALAIAVPLIFLGAAWPAWGAASGLRHSVFQCASALTGTGFSIAPDDQWNSLGAAVLIGLMLIGGGVNSTAGAIKQHRVHLIFRSLLWQVKRFFMPRSAVAVHQIQHGEKRIVVDAEHLRGVFNYALLYLLAWSAGSMILMGHGVGMQEAFFEFASALGGVGLTTGLTAPGAPAGVLWTEIAGMFLGRLEFFVVILGVTKIVLDLRDLSRRR